MGNQLMPWLDEACGWVMIVGGVGYASSSLAKLAGAGRGARGHPMPVQVGHSLLLSLVLLAGGVSALHQFRWTLAVWVAGALAATYVITLPIPGIVSRRKAGLPWWRFRTGVTPPPEPVGPVGDSTAALLIRRISNARFRTTRLTPGYDEQEVDIFLDSLVAALGESGELDPGLVRNTRFSTTRIGPGYAIHDVDSFLDSIARAI
jgi:DivIVA domain-containing protein